MKSLANFCLDEWLYYLENRHHQEIQMGLSRIEHVAKQACVYPENTKVITVAGTNGKGSTVSALEAIYSAAGYKVGCYTSPHLLAFNERIRVNLKPISDKNLCELFVFLSSLEGGEQLTYFEMATLSALLHFKQLNLDIIIIEVGIGGRLDATNIIDSDLAIITTVDLDHQETLGDTIEKIACEKAGILRPFKPFIYADDSAPLSIITHAQRIKAIGYYLNKEYSFAYSDSSIDIYLHKRKLVQIPIPSIHSKAAVAAIIASHFLQEFLPVKKTHWVSAMKSVFISGRKQLVKNTFTTLLDVAHNTQAVTSLVKFIEQQKNNGAVHAVFSALKDKDISQMIKVMDDCVDYWYPSLLESKRAINKSTLLEMFQTTLGSTPTCYDTPSAAYTAACQQAKPGDMVVVYGSFLTVSAVMSTLINHTQKDEVLL